ncbi:hypothetical protein EJB05_31425, partial [Eragrostis curvula]
MSGEAAPHVVEDFLGGVIQLLSDGSVVRADESVLMPKETFPGVPGVQWTDVVYDATRGLKVRLYRPPVASGEGGNNKLPVLVYFHGGGYCIGSYKQVGISDKFVQRVATELPALVLSVQYRLAPEHRLPAAVEDGATFLSWLGGQAALGAGAEPWLAESADFSRTFVSGESAGANLAHHVVVLASSGKIVHDPVRITGYVLLSAFFGSVERMASESEPPAGVSLTVEQSDQLWRMALPVGATRNHPLLALPPVLVVAPEVDVLRDHVLRYAARLQEMGKTVQLAEFKGEQHGFSVLRWGEASEELIRILKRFVSLHGTIRTSSSGSFCREWKTV